MNPLLDFSGLPRYAEIRPADISPAIDTLLAQARACLARVTAPGVADDWASFAMPLEDANERLSRAWGQVSHLHGVLDSPELRAAYNENLPKVTQYWTELGQDSALFAKFKALRGSPAYDALSAERRRVADNWLRDFHLGGADLPDAQKLRYAAIHDELARLSARFSENLLDATNAFTLLVADRARLAGLPDDALGAAREAAQKDDKEGWKFTLHMPSLLPVLQYSEDRSLRETLYRANVTRASEAGPAERDNTPLIADILRLRREESVLLGYRTFAERSLVPKMADTPAQVIDFLNDLAGRARPYAERDAAELREFARAELGLETLESWDLAYASEKLRERRYAFSEQEVKQYFPEDAVLGGLFKLVQGLFGVTVRPASAPVWHEDVRFFDVLGATGERIGQFYLDLYARETKRGGAWMDDAIGRRRKEAAIQTPVAYLNCNFSRPTLGKPALFTHDEVSTLFHEFGHGLHHLLTRGEELGVSGINGVEWDAVELPSQFMENFCWEWEVLSGMTRHVETGASLPRALFDKMTAAKNFHSGLGMLRQIEFSLFDMLLHHEHDPAGNEDAFALLERVRDQVAVMRPPAWGRFPNSFSHIFAGGYAAGYYSYKWAEVLSADAYAAFEEARTSEGVVSPAVGARFRDEVLAVGGSRDAALSFRAFRGRDPQVEALLRHCGMTPAPA